MTSKPKSIIAPNLEDQNVVCNDLDLSSTMIGEASDNLLASSFRYGSATQHPTRVWCAHTEVHPRIIVVHGLPNLVGVFREWHRRLLVYP